MVAMRIGSLFSGIGGLELGLERAGVGHAVWQVEQDEFCRGILEKHWPNVERHNDVKTFNAAFGSVDLICGGFPCQDVSSAGKGRGLTGERSGLWYEFARIVKEARPSWVVVENVASGATRWVDEVCAGLEQLGYETLPFPISAQAVGAPHRRDRIFIVGHTYRDRQPTEPVNAEAPGVPGVAGPTPYAPGVGREQEQRDTEALPAEAREQRQGELERGAREPWHVGPPVSPVLGVDDGLPSPVDRARRVKALGNAVVPQCAEVIGHIIQTLERA